MQGGHQDSNVQLDGSADVVQDEKSSESHASSPNQMHDDGLSSSLVLPGDVSPSVTVNARKGTGDAVGCIDNLPEALDKGDTSLLIGAVAAVDICGNKTGNGKLCLATSKEHCKQQEPGFRLLYSNEDSKDPCCSKDLVSEHADKGTEEKQCYKEGKCDSACSFQVRLCGRNSSDSSADSHCSQDGRCVVNVCINESPFPLTAGSSLPALSRPCNLDAAGLLTSCCSQAATEASLHGCRSEIDAQANALSSGEIGIDQNRIDCGSLPGNVLSVPPVTSGETEIIKFGVSSEEVKVKLCPVESTSVSQAYRNITGLSVITENKDSTTSPVQTSVSFSQFLPRSVSALSEDVSKCTSQINMPPMSVGISALAPTGPHEISSSQDVGPSLPSLGFYSSCSMRGTETFSFSKLQRNSFVSKSENFDSVPSSVTSYRNTDGTSQTCEDKTKFSLSCSLTNEQSTAIVISNESSCISASRSSLVVEVPSVRSISSGGFSGEPSPLSGFKFCTLGPPILSSAISKPLVAEVNVDTTSSAGGFSLESGKSFKFGAACAGSVIATALSTVACSNVASTSVQKVSTNIMTQSLDTSASTLIGIGGVDFPAVTTESLLAVPNSSAVSMGFFQLGSGVSSAIPAASVTKVTGFSSPTSLSLTKGTETLKSSQQSSKPSFRFRFPRSKPVKFTKNVDKNEYDFISSSGWDCKSGTMSNGFSFGGTLSQSPVVSSDFKSGAAFDGLPIGGTSSQSLGTSGGFKSDAASSGFSFGGTSSLSPATSNGFKSGAASNGFSFGGVLSQSPATSSSFKCGAASNGFSFGGTSSQSLAASSGFKSGAASNGFSFGGVLSQSPATSSSFKCGAASNGFSFGGTSQSLAASSGFKSGAACDGFSFGGTLSQWPAMSSNFKSGTTSTDFSFGTTSSHSPASSSDFKSGATSSIFSFGRTSPQSSPMPSNFDIGRQTAGFGFAMPANSSNTCFNMMSSHEKSQHCSQLKSGSSDSAQNKSWPFISTLPKLHVPFRALRGTETCIKNGITTVTDVRHQCITAMGEYSGLSFEELRLQYDKYNCIKQTESKAVVINKEVQTSKSHLEDVNYMADILNALECPVCLEIVTSPVLQCERGHHVCNDCWTQVTSCPLCKRPRSEARNYVAEAVLEKLLLPCKYRADGCAEMVYQVGKAAHEKTCLFRTLTCLVDECNQAYSVREMVQHLKSSHCHLISGSCFCVPKGLNFSHTLCQFTFQSLVHAFFIPGWGLFYLCHKVSGQNTCLWMQMIGRGALNNDFLYSVEVSDKLRSVAYQGPVVLMHTVTSELPNECLVITDASLAALRKSIGFCIKVSIWESNRDVE